MQIDIVESQVERVWVGVTIPMGARNLPSVTVGAPLDHTIFVKTMPTRGGGCAPGAPNVTQSTIELVWVGLAILVDKCTPVGLVGVKLVGHLERERVQLATNVVSEGVLGKLRIAAPVDVVKLLNVKRQTVILLVLALLVAQFVKPRDNWCAPPL